MTRKLFELTHCNDSVEPNDAIWAYAKRLGGELFEDDSDMAKYATITIVPFMQRDHALPAGETILPEILTNDQREDWLAGQAIRGAMEINKYLGTEA